MHPQSTLLQLKDVYRPAHLAERLWSRVDRSGGPEACWLWQGRHGRKGYGGITITYNGVSHDITTHRVAYLLAHGSIDVTLLVCHRCDVPACCNPAHLWQGTHTDNVHDRDAKGRTATGQRNGSRRASAYRHYARGEAHHNAKLTAEQVYQMRNLYAQGARIVDIACYYDVTQANVGYIVHGKSWRTG